MKAHHFILKRVMPDGDEAFCLLALDAETIRRILRYRDLLLPGMQAIVLDTPHGVQDYLGASPDDLPSYDDASPDDDWTRISAADYERFLMLTSTSDCQPIHVDDPFLHILHDGIVLTGFTDGFTETALLPYDALLGL